jgi:hypothetical protein
LVGTDKNAFEPQFIDIYEPTLLVKFQGCQHDPDCLLVPIVGVIFWLIVLFTVPEQASLSE